MTTNTRANGRTTPVILYRTLGRRKLLGFFTFALACIFGMPGTLLALLLLAAPSASAWEYWGGDQGGTRFSKLAQITPANVGNLVRAWEFHTGDLESRPPAAMARTKFEATPLFVEDSLILCSPFNEVIALDPGTGAGNGDTIPRFRPASARPTATIAAASPIGSTARRPKAPPAAAGYSWAPTMSASSRSTPRPAFPAPISATTAKSRSMSARSCYGRANSRSRRRRS